MLVRSRHPEVDSIDCISWKEHDRCEMELSALNGDLFIIYFMFSIICLLRHWLIHNVSMFE
jgi:hypothetical protein